ncbi:MAG: hypothetical protein IJA78_03800 [Clostridia bacterium]|nr:hypothetical protein [Clostridia bacterium]
MFYQFDGVLHTVPTPIAPPTQYTAAFVTLTELEQLAPLFGFAASTVQVCREEVRYFHNSMEIYDGYSFGTLKLTGDSRALQGEDCIAFYICRRLFLIVDIRDSDGSTRARFESAIRRYPPAQLTHEKLIFSFFDAMMEGDGRMLEDMEFDFSALEESVLCDEADDDFTILLLHHKQRLLLLQNYYEQLVEIGEALCENENDLFADEDLRYFHLFADKAERLCRHVTTLREQLSQLREAYQSTLDIRLNHIMKALTVISAIFLPLTLLTGWYGMNFASMPEFAWRYGYLYVALLALAVILICIRVFRRHHWM